MSVREEQCNKVCRILDDVLANRPTERDSLIVAVRKAFEALELFGNSEPLPSAETERNLGRWLWGGEWDDGRNKLVRCSICNAADIQAAGVIVPYCWHCGAEMEVQDE